MRATVVNSGRVGVSPGAGVRVLPSGEMSGLCSPPMKRALLISSLVLATFLVAPPGAGATTNHLAWQPSTTGSDARLRGLSAVSRHVAWASGSQGTILRTVDGGR